VAADVDHEDVSDLVAAARDGDDTAWAALVDRYSGMVWAVARGHRLSHADATDVSQTVWLRLAEHLHRLREPAAVGGWLATVARNESLRLTRQSARTMPTDEPPEPRGLPDVSFPVDTALADRTVTVLWSAFDQLNDRCRLLLRMLLSDPPPAYLEISAVLGMPVGSIGPTRARCLDRLRTLLADARINGTDRDSW
jgi:RNA polymerase sigma factor (sigma-70 family)